MALGENGTGADFHRAMVATAPGEKKTPHRAPPYEELDPATIFFFVSLWTPTNYRCHWCHDLQSPVSTFCTLPTYLTSKFQIHSVEAAWFALHWQSRSQLLLLNDRSRPFVLKTYLRSTMSQCRLNHVALLHVHKTLYEELDTNAVANEFIRRCSSIRRNTFLMQQELTYRKQIARQLHKH